MTSFDSDLKFFALFNPEIKPFVKSLGVEQKYNTNQAKEILGFNPIDHNKTLKDTAEYIDSF